jgi:hypothetical protein
MTHSGKVKFCCPTADVLKLKSCFEENCSVMKYAGLKGSDKVAVLANWRRLEDALVPVDEKRSRGLFTEDDPAYGLLPHPITESCAYPEENDEQSDRPEP